MRLALELTGLCIFLWAVMETRGFIKSIEKQERE